MASKKTRRQKRSEHREQAKALVPEEAALEQANSLTVPGIHTTQRTSGIALVVNFGSKRSIYGRDAKSITEAFESRGYDTMLCMDKHVQESVIEQAFQELRRKAWSGCTCMIYVGAHADEDEDGKMRMLPTGRHQSQGITFDWLREQITALPVQRLLLLVDCCYSGLLTRCTRSKRLWSKRSFTLVTSCAEDEKSECYEHEDNGPFANILFNALSGRGQISAIELATHVSREMPGYEDQCPSVESRGEDFPL